jgi:DNA-binding NtrC family response regulator
MDPRTVLVVADDLIWASRLVGAVEKSGSNALVAGSIEKLAVALRDLPEEAAVIIDLNGRAYDGVNAVLEAAEGGHHVLAVGQHEDLELRRRALDAGALRVFSYNKLFSDGPAVVNRLIEGDL